MTETARAAAEDAMTKATWQETLFAKRLRRSALIRLRADWPLRSFRVSVHRNQPFELIADSMRPFLEFAGIEATFLYGDYDDSLSFSDFADGDIHIVALDYDRYGQSFPTDRLLEWLSERLNSLRSRTTAPILVMSAVKDTKNFNPALERGLRTKTATYFCSVEEIAETLNGHFWDERSAEVKASAWSDQAVLHVARAFGLSWLPSLLLPPIKALAVDLDNTLYEGVLGEDGVSGVCIPKDFLGLQHYFNNVSANGIFVALVSRNELDDVDALFAGRPDFALNRSNISMVLANWDAKASNISNIARNLHIGTDSILFIDDNAGELAGVAGALPDIKTLHATTPDMTLQALEHYPGLFRFTNSREDKLRIADMVASQARQALQDDETASASYLESLDIKLNFKVDDLSYTSRMYELAHKTNQFNISLNRTPETEIVTELRSGTKHAVTVALRDRLSDSGTIGFIYGSTDGTTTTIDELAISCRALGRSLEDVIIFEAIRLINNGRAPQFVLFRWSKGSRNAPGLNWLRRWANDVGDDGTAMLRWDSDLIRNAVTAIPAALTTESSQ